MLAALLAAAGWASTARALTAQVAEAAPSLVGAAAPFAVKTADAAGAIEYRWDFGDGTRTEFTAGQSAIEHTYAEAGHYAVIVVIRDEAGFTSVSFTHTVHHPPTPRRPAASASILYDQARELIWSVNPDSDSLTAIHAAELTKLVELPVYRRPEALALSPEGKLWILHRDDYAVAVVDPDSRELEGGFRLPYASQPLGLAMSPLGDAAYVTLSALGKLLKLDPRDGAILAELDVGPTPRGVAVSADGASVFVTRFISPQTHGEVVLVDAAAFSVVRTVELALDETTEDTDQKGRGVPNYLFSVALSPDGREAWIPGKKDNVVRGLSRDGLALTQDNTVRPLVSVLDLALSSEALESRMDLDDRNLPSHVEFSPLGDYAFVTVTGSNLIEVRDVYKKSFVTALRSAGSGPRGAVLGPEGRLFVHGYLSRDIVVFDVSGVLSSTDQATVKLAEIPTVEQEPLPESVLLGKRVFNDSEDKRMTQEGYLSCASCHFEGFEDGRVWDFSDRGEGLRNTTSLLGRRGMGHGLVHWSGNFDEIQDFEGAMRANFGGLGFLPDELFDAGTRSDPLGDPKAGLSPELDALAAYVASLQEVSRSPFRDADGSLSEAAREGERLFAELACAACHAGPDFTDSASGARHDVGTLKPASGSRLGAELDGIDTPSLLGVWETAPYLHDGSAATLRDVLTTENPEDRHGETSRLSLVEIDQLVAYLQELDGAGPPRALPFETPPAQAPGPGAEARAAGCSLRAPRSGHEPAGVRVFALALAAALAGRRARVWRLQFSTAARARVSSGCCG